VPGIAEAMRAKTVVGVSPIIGGAPVRGMADACLTAIGVPTTAAAVAAHYGADLLDGWLVDSGVLPAPGSIDERVIVQARPLLMHDVDAAAEIAHLMPLRFVARRRMARAVTQSRTPRDGAPPPRGLRVPTRVAKRSGRLGSGRFEHHRGCHAPLRIEPCG